MVVKAVLLFLFGASATAGPIITPQPTDIIISKHQHGFRDTEYLPLSGHHPFISNFIQKGTNVFFKPQFAMSSADSPIQVQHITGTIAKEDCETPTYPHVILEEPLHVIEHEIIEEPPKVEHIVFPSPPHHVIELEEPKKPISVPPAPVLPPMEIPTLPVIIEESHVDHEIPCDAPALVIEDIEPQNPTIVEIEEPKEPVVVPPAPILPPMEMPQLPVLIEEAHTEHNLPCEPVVLAIEEPKPHVVIPPAPLLPPMKQPELPVIVEESHIVPELPCPPTVVKEFKPIIIAKPPKHVIFKVDRPKHHVFSPVPIVHSMPKPILVGDSHHVQTITNIPHPVIMDPHPILISNFHTKERLDHMHVAREQKLISTLSEIQPHWY